MVHMCRRIAVLGLVAVAVALSAVPSYAAKAQPAKPVISYVFYDGDEPRTEGDEYAVVSNTGGTAINLQGYRLNAGDGGQDFRFPSFTLKPGAQVRIYTNRTIKGSFSFRIARAIWNNKGDCGYLFNQKGGQVNSYCY